MYKETIICIVTIILILIGNVITQNYTKSSVEETSKSLINLREEISKEENEVNNDIAKDKINKIHEKWDKRHDKLAYYIEHDELEKVETNLTKLRSFIESNEYQDAMSELDDAVFLLRHIEEKNKFNLENIF